MRMGEIFTAPVERIVSGGAGIVRYRGKSVFINLTAPGDLVTGRIIEENKDWAWAELLEISEPSPLRKTPFCPLYGSCGGCSLQHLSYEAQLAEKSRMLRDALVRLGSFSSFPEPAIHPSAPEGYRNRMQFHRIKPIPPSRRSRSVPSPAGSRRPFPLGFKARKSGELIPVADCPVADPGIRRVLAEGTLPIAPDRDRFTVYARGNTLVYEGGPSRGKVTLLDRELLMDAGVFFQSNGTALELLIPELLEAAGGADPSLPMADIYCGVGTFAVFLGEYFSRIDLVEENRQALSLARENMPGGNCRFFPLKADQWVKTRGTGAKSPGKGPYGFIIVDPPRQGLSGTLRQWLIHEGPPVLAYVSCDPATLARDSRELCRGGYGLEKLSFHDFYPQTAHIETLAVFKK
ncbi:class I SAM-dependent RNA methyltransferase [Treponema sp. TIM-1]|uniref:class I SAM-dependent RNA methyltransferase n=1 Tax=Treponema sp. TIM-1 TaxID=2898417 RepID=UPI00397FC896